MLKTENHLGNAHQIIRQRIRNSKTFKKAYQTVLNEAQSTIQSAMLKVPIQPRVNTLRALGGYTTVLRSAINSTAPTKVMGSKLVPLSVRDILIENLPSLRAELQCRIAAWNMNRG